MQTSLQRRQRHRRAGAARRGRGGGAGRRVALAIPLLLFSSFLALGSVGFVGAIDAYAYYNNGLPDPATAFTNLTFDQPSVVWDRTGKVQLATFGEQNRAVAKFSDIPPEMFDATTAIEDKDFWSNPGFDIGAFISATIDTLSGRPRGASTITQQLVRARLLPASVLTGTTYDRKIKEIIQSIRLTQEFPGVAGKQAIITAYLNQNFYGNQSYGIMAAAEGYFGKNIKDLDLAQWAILAAIPQSPTDYDLTQNAISQCTVPVATDGTCPAGKDQLVVPDTAPIVQRRNQVLLLMETRSVLSGANHTIDQYQAAMREPVVLVQQVLPQWKAPQFDWQVRQQLGTILCGAAAAATCEQVNTGGYQVTTTLDWPMQQVVDKWLYAAARAPLAKTAAATRAILKKLGISASDGSWLLNFRGQNIHDSAGAVIDYRTGQVLAYDGSAQYYSTVNDKAFQPQYDVMSNGFRQPGSSIKPLNYITGLDDHTITASTTFMDVVTQFSPGWAPADADKLERGPVRMRSALQFSLNIPSIKASFINGFNHLFQRYQAFGLHFPPGSVPVESMGIGTLDIHMIDLLGAYGAIANRGVLMPRSMILQVRDHTGAVVYPAQGAQPAGQKVATPQASYIISNILEGNTITSVNAYWAANQITLNGKRRPAAYKTGTTDNNKDMDAFGFLPPPAAPNLPALAVGVWLGNSDATAMAPITSVASSGALWSHIMRDVSKGLPLAEFKEPSGIVTATVDKWSGLLPGPYTTATVKELFINGTVPTHVDNLHVRVNIDQATGLLWQAGCTGPEITRGYLDFSSAEPGFPRWQTFTEEWAARAARGPGVVGGPARTATSYFFDGFLVPFGRTWGGSFAPTRVCSAVPPPTPPPTCGPGGGPPTPQPSGPCPTPSPTPSGTPHNKPTPTPT